LTGSVVITSSESLLLSPIVCYLLASRMLMMVAAKASTSA